MVKPQFILDYALIKDQIDRLLQSVPNKLEREWPKSPTPPTNQAYTVILGTVTIATNTFKTIRFLCAEKSQDWRHRPEMSLTVPILARTILDALYTCVFIFEDLSRRADWYMSSGWKELAEYVDRAKRDYGADDNWVEYFSEAELGLKGLARLIGKPHDEIRNTSWWPTPQQMKRIATKPSSKAFFRYLDDWYYREFSQISHGTLPGLIHSAGSLRKLSRGEPADIEQIRGYHFLQVVILLISLYSELEITLKLGVTADLNHVWGKLNNEHYPFAREIYDRREYSTTIATSLDERS
jgi:Family of unknown function (DUF5677)